MLGQGNQLSDAARKIKAAKQVYHVKDKTNGVEISNPSSGQKRATTAEVFKIGTDNVVVKELCKGSIIIDNFVNLSTSATVQQGHVPNDHEASSSKLVGQQQ